MLKQNLNHTSHFAHLTSNKGITLIALIITIIVMLILVAVTINMAINGGLFNYAGKATEETIMAKEKEQIGIAYISAKLNNSGNDVTATDLQNELNKVTKTRVDDNGDGTLNVFFIDTDNNYNIDNGNVSKVEILEAGLYDADKNLVASCETLINTYGLDIEKNYTPSTSSTDTASPRYILTNSSELSTGSILVIDDSITRLGDCGFTSCSNLTNIIIPNSVTEIGTRAIQLCNGLTSIKLPNSVTTIGDYAFNSCTNLTNISIPNSVVTIGSNAFDSCNNLSSVSLPSGITTLAYNLFYKCTSLSNIVIPDSVTTIENNAFIGCKSLTKIYIPISVTTIQAGSYRLSPFYSCLSSLIIYCGATEKQSGWGNNWNYYSSSAACATNYGYTREQYEAICNQ